MSDFKSRIRVLLVRMLRWVYGLIASIVGAERLSYLARDVGVVSVGSRRSRGEVHAASAYDAWSSADVSRRSQLISDLASTARKRPVSSREPVLCESYALSVVCSDLHTPGLEAFLLSLHANAGIRPQIVVHFVEGSLSLFNRRRVASIDPGTEFRSYSAPDVSFLNRAYPNHSRVGKFGLLSLKALELEGFDRIIVADADLLVLREISVYATHGPPRVVADIGNRPYPEVTRSGRVRFNSGLFSIPGEMASEASRSLVRSILESWETFDDPALNRFTDQKVWNLLLQSEEIEFLPVEYNLNKTLFEENQWDFQYSPRVLHITGPKPWIDLLPSHERSDEELTRAKDSYRVFPRSFSTWRHHYRQLALEHRTRLYRQCMSDSLEDLKGAYRGRHMIFIGNAPSLDLLNPQLEQDAIRVGFNWLPLHPDFSKCHIEHLVVSSHLLFGGWSTATPQMHPDFLEALRRVDSETFVWFPFYFRDYLEGSRDFCNLRKRYFLSEKPFRQQPSLTGEIALDLSGPLTDTQSGLTSVGFAVAKWTDPSSVGFLGVEFSYSASNSSDHFYSDDSSPATARRTLDATWGVSGSGVFAFHVGVQQLKREGIRVYDTGLPQHLRM